MRHALYNTDSRLTLPCGDKGAVRTVRAVPLSRLRVMMLQ